MRSKQLYLQAGYCPRSFHKERHVPSYRLSTLLHEQMGKCFNYLTKYLVLYSKQMIYNGVTHNLNLNGLAKKCGFNNWNYFTDAFEKLTWRMPLAYVKELENQVSHQRTGTILFSAKDRSPSYRCVSCISVAMKWIGIPIAYQ